MESIRERRKDYEVMDEICCMKVYRVGVLGLMGADLSW